MLESRRTRSSRRLEAASKYFRLSNICLSSAVRLSSTVEGNSPPIEEEKVQLKCA